jgi:iron complex outermembrane receptor protein
MTFRIAAVLALPLLAAAAPLAAQTPTSGLDGSIRSAATQQPVTTAVVRLGGGPAASVDAEGEFSIALRPGTYAVEVRAPGYLPHTATTKIVAGGRERLDIALVPSLRYDEDLVVTASGRPEAPDDLVHSVGHVSREDLTRAKGVGVDETLNAIPGVKAESQAETQEVRVSVRGRGLRTSFGVSGVRILVDGMPETDATGETSDLTGIDPAALERVEVVKGPMAGQYGASTSGVVNFITPSGGATPTVDVKQSLGSYGFHKTQAVLSGTAGPVRIFGSYSDTGQDGYRAHSRLDSHHLSTRFDARVAGATVSAFVRNTSVATQLPGNMSAEEMRADRRAASGLFTAFDARSDIDRTQVGGSMSKAFASRGELALNAFVGSADFNVPVPFVVLDGHRVMSGASGRYYYDSRAGGHANRFSAGVDFQRTTEDRADLENHFGGGRGPEPVRDENRLISNAGIAVLDTFEVTPALTLRGGLNYSSVKIAIDDFLLADGDGSGDTRFSRVSAVGGARYRLSPSASVFGTVSTGFDPPTISAIGRDTDGSGLNAALRPERSTNIEGGVNLMLPKSASLAASAFYMRIMDEIVPAGTGVPQETFVNAAETRHAGFEAVADVPVAPRVRVRATYTFSGFTYEEFVSRVGDVAGNRLPGVPRNRTTLAVTYSDRLGISAGLGWLANGQMYADDGNAYGNDAYYVTSLFAGYQRQVQHLKINVLYRLNNAFNDEYVAYLVVNDRFNGFYYPSAGRNHGFVIQGGWRF